MQRFVASVCLVSAVLLSGCGSQPSQSSLDQFFENSTRRDPNQAELDMTAKVGGCAAFFVGNDVGKTYLITARHCVNYSITSWCNDRGTVVSNSGVSGICSRIVAADAAHDIALFEAEGIPMPSNPVSLAAYVPDVGTRMQMIGYPADQDPQNPRRGRITTTENCWVLSDTVSSPHSHPGLKDQSLYHNCSTYGGNSGGPMIAENTEIALGLPFTYMPNDYNRRSSTNLSTAAHMAQMADFVRTHRSTLEQEGVDIQD